MDDTSLYTIGHGRKTIEEFIKELEFFDISYLIDVRTVPYSKWSPQFNQEALKNELKKYPNIEYVWWGNPDPENDIYIGGRALGEDCYDEDGFFDYKEMAKDYRFKKGLERLVIASEKRYRGALMCSESDPSECHRSKLIGRELYIQYNININHIVGCCRPETETEVINKLTKNTWPDMFNSPMPTFKSRKSYKKVSQIDYQYYD